MGKLTKQEVELAAIYYPEFLQFVEEHNIDIDSKIYDCVYTGYFAAIRGIRKGNLRPSNIKQYMTNSVGKGGRYIHELETVPLCEVSNAADKRNIMEYVEWRCSLQRDIFNSNGRMSLSANEIRLLKSYILGYNYSDLGMRRNCTNSYIGVQIHRAMRKIRWRLRYYEFPAKLDTADLKDNILLLDLLSPEVGYYL